MKHEDITEGLRIGLLQLVSTKSYHCFMVCFCSILK